MISYLMMIVESRNCTFLPKKILPGIFIDKFFYLTGGGGTEIKGKKLFSMPFKTNTKLFTSPPNQISR